MKLKGFKGGFSLKVRSLGCGLLAQGGSAQVGTGRKGMPTLAASYTSTPFPLCSRRPCCFSPSRRTPAPSCALLLFRLDNCCCKFCMNMWWFNCRRGSEGEEERRRGEGREEGKRGVSLGSRVHHLETILILLFCLAIGRNRLVYRYSSVSVAL